MAVYRYLVTVETTKFEQPNAGEQLARAIDAEYESRIMDLAIEHFTVERMPVGYWPGRGFVESSLDRPASLSPDG